MNRSVAAVRRSSEFKRYNELSIFLKPRDEFFPSMKACVWIPTGPHWSLSRLVSSLTTARFEFTTVDSLIGSNHRPLDRRTRSDRRGRAGRPLRRGSGGSACAAPGLPVTSFLFRCSVNLPQVVDRNPNAGVPRGGAGWSQTATAEGCCSVSTPAGLNRKTSNPTAKSQPKQGRARSPLRFISVQTHAVGRFHPRMHVPRDP